MTLAEFCERISGCKLADWQKEALEQAAILKPHDRSSKQRAYAERAAVEFLAKHRGPMSENSHAGVYDAGPEDQQFDVFWSETVGAAWTHDGHAAGWYWAALRSGRRGGPFATSKLAADDAGYELRMHR